MPSYTYSCESCGSSFEIICSIKDYKSKTKCVNCGSKKTYREYTQDLQSLNTSVKKGDSELKTIGDLANRNRDRMSSDQKAQMHYRHNEYKERTTNKELPKGMSRMQKPKGVSKNFLGRLKK